MYARYIQANIGACYLRFCLDVLIYESHNPSTIKENTSV